MAEVDIQRKEGGTPWWAWLLGAVIVGLILWWIVSAAAGDRDQAAETTGAPAVTAPVGTDTAATEGARAATAALPLAEIEANPDAYFGQQVSGLATVTEVLPNQGFWIEQDGNRMFVVQDSVLENAAAVNAGQQVSLTGTVLNPDEMEQNAGVMALPEDTRQMLQGLPAFLQATNIETQDA